MKTEIKDIWSKHSQQSGNGTLIQRVEQLTHLNCFIGTILISKAKVFTLELENDVIVNRQFLKRFSGVEIQVLESDIRQLAIILLEPGLSEIFHVFIEDILESLSEVENQQEAVYAISRKVSLWRTLFGKYASGLLSPQEQRGLFGELSLMKIFLEMSIESASVVEAWKAPSGTNQDFYFGNIAIEVKTSISNNPSIKIANEYQLDNSGYSSLYLAFFRLIELPSGENTLSNLINEIRILLTDSDVDRIFDSWIKYIGITSELEKEYNNTSYEIRKIQCYRVEEQFPKITAEMVNKAISQVSYEIFPNQCSDYNIPIEEIVNDILNVKK